MDELQDIKLQIGKNQKLDATAYPQLLCFHDLSIQQIRYGMHIFKKDKYMVYGREWVVEGEWLEGKPHGVCIYDNEYERGVATFTRG